MTAENWLEANNLFEAAMFWVRTKKDNPEIRRECLKIALNAAAHSLDLDFLNTQISDEVRSLCYAGMDDILRKEEGWFCDGIVDLYKRKLGGKDYENALTLYNIGEVLKAKGEQRLAAEAFASSHALFPMDIAPAMMLKDVQMELEDWRGALATLAELETAQRELGGSESGLGRIALDAGDAYLNLGMYVDAEKSLMFALRTKLNFAAENAKRGDTDRVL